MYASDTPVPVEKSRAEIERIIARYGADQFLSGWDIDSLTAFVQFRCHGRVVRLRLGMPKKDDLRFYQRRTSHGRETTYERNPAQIDAAWEQAQRSRWRALCLIVKAKLEAVEAGISTFENEFLASISMPDGTSFGEWAKGAIAQVYDTGKMLPAHVDSANEEDAR